MVANEGFFHEKQGQLSETLQLQKRMIPEPKDGEIIVKIVASALNPVDEQLAESSDQLLKLMGKSTGHAKVPGCDFSGIVHAAGKLSKWPVGEEVCGLHMSNSGDGTMQKYLRLPKDATICRKPTNLSHQRAAAFPLVYSTVHTAFIKWGRLSFPPVPGQDKRSVLILGGSGGTGTMAIQLAKAMDLRVVATCSTGNVEFLLDLGADEVIDYVEDDVLTAALYSPYGPFAVVLDCVGGADFIPHLDNLLMDDPKAPELGIYITIVGDKTDRSSMGGPVTNVLNPSQAFRAACGALRDYVPRWMPLRSFITWPRYMCIMLEASESQLASIKEYTQRGGKIIIDSEWSFEDIPKAYAKLESGRAVGKIVVNIE